MERSSLDSKRNKTQSYSGNRKEGLVPFIKQMRRFSICRCPRKKIGEQLLAPLYLYILEKRSTRTFKLCDLIDA